MSKLYLKIYSEETVVGAYTQYIPTGKQSAGGKSSCKANQAARNVRLNQRTESYKMVTKLSMVLCGRGTFPV